MQGDHDVSISLDFGEEWATYWPKLIKRGWTTEDNPEVTFAHTFYVPPGARSISRFT